MYAIPENGEVYECALAANPSKCIVTFWAKAEGDCAVRAGLGSPPLAAVVACCLLPCAVVTVAVHQQAARSIDAFALGTWRSCVS